MDEASETELIRQVLTEVFPLECMSVGRANVRDIVQRRGDVTLVPVEGASRLDWSVPLLLLVSATTILTQALAVARTLVEVSRKTPAEIRVEILVSVPAELKERIPPEKLDQLVDSLVSHAERIEYGGDLRG